MLRDTLRRLACRWLDLVTVEQLQSATAAVDARWTVEQIEHRARLAELERKLREAVTGAKEKGGNGEGEAPEKWACCPELGVACPVCKAPPGEPCSEQDGYLPGLHFPRVALVLELPPPVAPGQPLEFMCPECWAPLGAHEGEGEGEEPDGGRGEEETQAAGITGASARGNGEGEGEEVRHAVKQNGDCAEWCRRCAKDEEKRAHRRPLAIECPECWAPPGAQCLDLYGEPVEWAHESRIDAAGGVK